MINPAEEMVNIWLQDCQKHFVMSNLVVPKCSRKGQGGKKIGGGRGKEIDFLSTDGKGNYYWVEVSVSPNPRLPGGADKSMPIFVDDADKKFTDEKLKWLKNNFKIGLLNKWFVYSPNLFLYFSKKTKTNDEEIFRNKLKKLGIDAISFGSVLSELYDKINYYGYDWPRQYIFLFKKMGYKK
ncbi:MAG: hypothetical protein ABR968_13120 [Bacteroidales bacterium]|jgi:hypothetical protein